jgi:hypothetical protein
MHDSSTCPVCRGQPRDSSLSDEQFFAFLAVCREELAEKQAAFSARIAGAPRWSYDLADGSLTIGEERFAITALGTHSAEYQSWLWAWANDDFPESARKSSRRIRQLHDLTGFRVFLDDGVPASSLDAQDLSSMAIHLLGAIGLFRAPAEGGPTLYLAVHESS